VHVSFCACDRSHWLVLSLWFYRRRVLGLRARRRFRPHAGFCPRSSGWRGPDLSRVGSCHSPETGRVRVVAVALDGLEIAAETVRRWSWKTRSQRASTPSAVRSSTAGRKAQTRRPLRPLSRGHDPKAVGVCRDACRNDHDCPALFQVPLWAPTRRSDLGWLRA